MKFNIDYCKSNTDDWRTPSKVYNKFIEEGYIDPCPYQSTINGLDINYVNKRLFINPPYSDISRLVDYAIQQYVNGCDVVLLIPSRTDTIYFHKLLNYHPYIYFVKGRLHFNDSKKTAPFPSMFVELCKSLSNLMSLQYDGGDIDTYLNNIL